MKHLKSYNLFESSSSLEVIKEIFHDVTDDVIDVQYTQGEFDICFKLRPERQDVIPQIRYYFSYSSDSLDAHKLMTRSSHPTQIKASILQIRFKIGNKILIDAKDYKDIILSKRDLLISYGYDIASILLGRTIMVHIFKIRDLNHVFKVLRPSEIRLKSQNHMGVITPFGIIAINGNAIGEIEYDTN